MPSRDPRPAAVADDAGRSESSRELVARVIAGDLDAVDAVLAAAPTSADPGVLVVAAVLSGERGYLDRGAAAAGAARDRQLVALADAFLRGDHDLFDVLVREHLAAYPDQVPAAWLAARHSASPSRRFVNPERSMS
ncbi:hypothetical protein [Microlunatus ginsengisoli]|uniref:hypothetical protein n=1 Tax=Microlunatus ginsengisoli TaxID=363863 RepID=UPI0031E16FD6